jgi:hypothetical protein
MEEDNKLNIQKDRRKPSEELVQILNVSGPHKISSKKLLAKDY